MLDVVEETEEVRVVWRDNPDDWLVCFDRTSGFPAREWAANMVRIYNRRISRDSTVPPTRPGQRQTSYHPEV